MAQYRCAIVGCGPRAGWHARAYGLIDRGRLVACCDVDAPRLEEFSDEHGLTPYADAAEMIEAERPDLVHVVTPPTVRVELMRLASELGVPACLVEKPIALGVWDWRALCELARASATKFAVGMQVRYHEHLTRCRDALRSGDLGEFLFLDFSAGMNIACQGVHILDWAMYLNGESPVAQVLGAASGAEMAVPNHPGPDSSVAEVLFANGVRGAWHNGPAAPRVGDEATTWQHCRAAGFAERGRVLYEEFGRWEVVSPDGVEGGWVADAEEWAELNHAAQAGLTNAIFDWLEDDSRPAGTHLARALHQWQAILGLYASALWRRPVDIPFEPPDDLFEQLRRALAGA
jgi:predicted dehydrogenase